MGYRPYGDLESGVWAKPVGNKILLWQSKEMRWGIYFINKLGKFMCWRTVDFKPGEQHYWPDPKERTIDPDGFLGWLQYEEIDLGSALYGCGEFPSQRFAFMTSEQHALVLGL